MDKIAGKVFGATLLNAHTVLDTPEAPESFRADAVLSIRLEVKCRCAANR